MHGHPLLHGRFKPGRHSCVPRETINKHLQILIGYTRAAPRLNRQVGHKCSGSLLGVKQNVGNDWHSHPSLALCGGPEHFRNPKDPENPENPKNPKVDGNPMAFGVLGTLYPGARGISIYIYLYIYIYNI